MEYDITAENLLEVQKLHNNTCKNIMSRIKNIYEIIHDDTIKFNLEYNILYHELQSENNKYSCSLEKFITQYRNEYSPEYYKMNNKSKNNVRPTPY